MDVLEAIKLISPWLLPIFAGIIGMHWHYRRRDLERVDLLDKDIREMKEAVFKLQMSSEVAIKGNSVEISSLRNDLGNIKNDLYQTNKELKDTTKQLMDIFLQMSGKK